MLDTPKENSLPFVIDCIWTFGIDLLSWVLFTETIAVVWVGLP